MKFNKKNLYLKAAASFASVYLLTFIIYYLGNHILSSGEILIYADIFLSKLTYLMLPIAAGVITLIFSVYESTKGAMLRLIPLSLCRMIYFIPYFYLVFFMRGMNSIDSILLSLLSSISDAALSYALTLAICFLLRFIITKRTKTPIADALAKRTELDFSDPVSASLAIICGFVSVYFIITEIGDTVSFLINYGLTFTLPEIIYTLISYILDAALFFIHYYVIAAVKNRIIEKRVAFM